VAKIVLKVGSNLLVKEDSINKTYIMNLVSVVNEIIEILNKENGKN